jgi:ABC-2 type transport system permease protein
MVYDREMGLMRLLLTAPLPRWYLLLCKLLAGTFLSVLQAYAFLALCVLFKVDIPWSGWLYALVPMILVGMMLGALGLLLSVTIKQLENFAGTMNFVIFPMFFLSTALYPLWKLQESGAEIVYQVARFNPFTHAVELIRFALYGQFNGIALAVVVGAGLLFFALAVWGYNPQYGMAKKVGSVA